MRSLVLFLFLAGCTGRAVTGEQLPPGSLCTDSVQCAANALDETPDDEGACGPIRGENRCVQVWTQPCAVGHQLCVDTGLGPQCGTCYQP